MILRSLLRHAVQDSLIAYIEFLKDACAGQVSRDFGLVQPLAIREPIEVHSRLHAGIHDRRINTMMFACPHHAGNKQRGSGQRRRETHST